MKLTFHSAVQREVDDACAWYDERKDHLGDEFFQEVERVLDLVAANPQAFPLASRGRRKAHLKRFPYTVFLPHPFRPCAHLDDLTRQAASGLRSGKEVIRNHFGSQWE